MSVDQLENGLYTLYQTISDQSRADQRLRRLLREQRARRAFHTRGEETT